MNPDPRSRDPQEAFAPPPPTSDRDYDEPKTPSAPLYPMAPREQDLVRAFKKTVAQHAENRGEKTTEEFLDKLALDLWRLTRK